MSVVVRKLATVFVLAALCMTSTGCWSATEIQSNGYAKALGLDYNDGIFTVYVQLLEFVTLARADSGGSGKEPNLWVGVGKGKTLDIAINELFRTAQMHMTWGHVTAVILSERLLESDKLKGVIDMINRFPESRYTTWVYGTKEPIKDLLSTNSIFNESPLTSILHNPLPSYKDDSLYPPVLGFQFITKLNGPEAEAYLPNLTLNKQDWSVNKRERPLFKIDGAFFEHHGTFAYLPHKRLAGFSWMQPQMRKSPAEIEEDGTIYGSLSVGLPKIKVIPIVEGDEVRFRIKAKYMAALYEYIEPISYEKMVDLIEKKLKKQIFDTYQAGIQQGVDVYGLQEKLYRSNSAAWKKASNNGTVMFLTEDSLESVSVKLRVAYNGKYKRRT
ncbi:Ger(x)C family spore germination protein [Paenibacillus sp. NEAU-GSW1]|uniref:Ger(x)C family spore germination protein n=1 Tax=Paenibacillus sp. NEAU-GSW1 TaxID=2682486 RepID=UPI0012E2D389|nr:Ger(x)C family spore germination protein [Paenibacillus sp. NEAU-GSW1]MUT64385.1 Ger(x)C family spore germination protein [Paenibacillus sp. NEAU-GSW1]